MYLPADSCQYTANTLGPYPGVGQGQPSACRRLTFTKPLLNRHFFSLVLGLLLSYGTWAQLLNPFPFQFKLYTTQHGLSHNYTYKCQQDAMGFLWIATQYGLNRFDGYRFEHFYHHPTDTQSLPQNDIPALAIDRLNRIWTGGAKGIGVLNQANGKVTRLAGHPWPAQVWALVYDSVRNYIWVAHRKGITGINASVQPGIVQQITLPLEQPPTSISLLPQGQLLMHVTRRSSWLYNPLTGDTTRLPQFHWLTNTLINKQGEVWLCGWGTGMHRLNTATMQAITSFNPKVDNYGIVISDLLEAPALTGDSLLWIIGTNTGKMLYHKRTNDIVHRFAYEPQLKNTTATELHNSAYYAPDGSLWVCSWMGLEKVNNYTHMIQQGELPALHTVEYNMLSGIQPHASRPQMLWVGIHGSGIALMNGATGLIEKSWYRVLPRPGNDIYYGQRWIQSLQRDNKGVIWGGSYDGFVRVEKDAVSFVPLLLEKGQSLYGEYSLMDREGWLWMTCWKGLVAYHTSSGQKKVYEVRPLPQHNGEFPVLEGLATDERGYKYMGGQFGLLRFKEGLQDTVRLWYNTLPRVERIISLAVVGQHLVIAAESGLYNYNLATGYSRLINKSIVPVHAHGCKADGLGNVWMYTQAALVKYTPAKDSIQFFNTTDGLYAVNKDWATLFEFNGQMHLGHRMAYSRWHPGLAGSNRSRPQVWVSSIYLNRKRLPYEATQDTSIARLAAGFRNLQFNYTAIEYQHADQLEFRWRLLGYDTVWQKGNASRVALFTSLPAGTYTFQVKAFNSSGLASAGMASIRFEVQQYWWLSPWLLVAAAMLALALIAYIVRRREKLILQKAEKENALQKQIAGLQMATLRSQMNPHFIFNSLNSIQKFIWENKKDDASEFLSKFARLIRSILHLSNREIITLQEELDLLKLYIDLEHRRCNGKFEYTIKVDDNVDVQATKIPPLLLQPFVENAIWHGLSPLTHTRGAIEVWVSAVGGQISITITDNGIGRREAERIKAAGLPTGHSSMGLSLIKERMELLGHQLQRPIYFTIRDVDATQVETGTVVTLFL